MVSTELPLIDLRAVVDHQHNTVLPSSAPTAHGTSHLEHGGPLTTQGGSVTQDNHI